MWIGQQPPAETVVSVKGRVVHLSCPVQGVPTPTITWSFSKGDKRPESKYWTALYNTNRTLLTGNGSLIFSPVDEQRDQGVYQCLASNGVGSDLTALITLQIRCNFFLLID